MRKAIPFLVKNKIVILGESLDYENFPKLYKWAKENKQTLIDSVQSLARSFHNGNIVSAMQALESDLEHG